MRTSQLGAAQIVGVRPEGEAGVPLAEVLRTRGISRATYGR
jgi:hypothetical protein